MKQICDLMISNCGVVLPDFTLYENADIAVKDGIIVKIGPSPELSMEYQAEEYVDGKGKLALPGLYDCHTHTVQQLLKGGTVDEPPIIWRRILVPYESAMNEEDRYHAARLYCMQALKAGIVMFADAGSMDMSGTIRAVEETGIQAAIARVGRDLDKELPESMCDKTAEECISNQKELYKKYHKAADGRIRIWYSISSPMSASPELVEGIAEAAKEGKTGIHIHLGEHPAEVQTCLQRFGMRPPEFMAAHGALGSNVIAAHCIQITDFDIKLMAKQGVNVIHCPTANLPTQGIPKLLAERAAGLNIALGNDGATSARQDLFQQAQILKYVTQAVYGTPVFEPNVLPLAEAFQMMTSNGAKALGVGEITGRLDTGKAADIILLDVDRVEYMPSRNILHTMMMIATSQDVTDVVIRGKVIIKNRAFISLDEEKILFEGQQQMKKMLKRVNH